MLLNLIMKKSPLSLTRRTFLNTSAIFTSGLLLAVQLPVPLLNRLATATEGQVTPLNAWLRIGVDETITIIMPHCEMGQGVHTALPMLVAEELDVHWQNIRVEMAPIDEIYVHPTLGQQATGGSFSVAGRWLTLRHAGAEARERLIRVAAIRWQVKPQDCYTEAGKVILTADVSKTLTYGQLVEEAAKLNPPQEPPPLKSPSQFKVIGKSIKRLDTPAKVDGSAQFGIDVRVPGMWYAAVKQSPVFDASLKAYYPTTLDGVHIVEIPNGIAVVATSYWQAKQGLEKLKLRFDKTVYEQEDSATIMQKLQQGLTAQKSAQVVSQGDIKVFFETAKKFQESEYSVPFLAHATLEPMNCTADVKSDRCEIWVGTQAPEKVRETVAELTELPTEKITVHTTYLGGSFGRRLEVDFVTQAVLISKQLGKPVQVIWSREEDLQHDFYRPAMVANFKAGLDDKGMPTVLTARLVGPSVLSRAMPNWVKKDLDYLAIQGVNELPYRIRNLYIDYVMQNTFVPVGFWRSLGHSYNAFFVESFIDQLAHASQRDPYEFRKALLTDQADFLQVLDTLAEKSNWKNPAPSGRYRGLAIHQSFGSIVGQVAEISVTNNVEVRIQRVITVLHCGIAVNPQLIEAQVESGIVFGLGMLKQAITLKKGRVAQNNFDDYPILRMADMPLLETHILPSEADPTGIGEVATPPVVPAVTNAIFAATGKRIRELPIIT